MKILFIQALSMEGIDIERVYPIGIVVLASQVERCTDHRLALFDMNMALDPYGDLRQQLDLVQPDVICLSLRNIDPLGNKTSSLIPSFAVTLAVIKRYAPKTRILVGGTGFSLFPDRLMNEYPEIDFGVTGEAENIIVPLLNNLNDPPRLPGLCYREKEAVIIVPPVGDYDMRDYIMPNRDLLDPRPYLTVNKYVESIGVETKRGCCFCCGYCSYPLLQGTKMRCRTPEAVVDEIQFLYETYGVTRIHFTDSVVNIPVDHLDSICAEIIRRGLPINWSGFFRENLLTEENVALYAQSGCECFSLSPDGLSQTALDALDKNMKVQDILDTAQVLAASGVVTVYHFLVNTPGDTAATQQEAKELIDAIYKIHHASKTLGTIVLNNIRILPGTRVEQQALEHGVITPETDLLYPTYYNPAPYDRARYELEIYHTKKNIFMWQEVTS
ncbi:Anaerobic magnesium-protoporphyrin IX monomethyl ester cyclase [Acetobacterium wieringae]|uniref:B12 lower ligand biosynthesis radical SAM protein BzaD n=1 Tax=Acetobacterium wieringae TaxID=52694 RepID=UPI001D89DE0C|nr:B12 lower ligand biosynthesis radical SAM protein BzaD [Acetobacterium wieringae]VUZ28261.1 Anaerobic magnesium-protoporphyrin IX monomethyl ester cyclase [Acetobacterium wieringae]